MCTNTLLAQLYRCRPLWRICTAMARMLETVKWYLALRLKILLPPFALPSLHLADEREVVYNNDENAGAVADIHDLNATAHKHIGI